MRTKDISLIASFSAMWTVLQIYLGPIVGRFSIGPISFHGSVNRIVGWLLMTVLAEQTTGFGKITLMTTIAALGTRSIRGNILEGIIVGIGYAFGGLIFDALINLKSQRGKGFYILISMISALAASIPYLASKIYFLGLSGFIKASPAYIFSIAKGVFFSFLGASLGLGVNASLKHKSLQLKK
ncbi:MAG: hypothetical protein QW476_01935 [Candidatus Bathyarchaeia archaeon]|nr:hypothetical protein [Candidatus Bathyarchaeota archaeon]